MKFATLAEARYYHRTHPAPFRKKLRVVKCRYWSMEQWAFVPCYTVVMR
jgi:hypothetical protein